MVPVSWTEGYLQMIITYVTLVVHEVHKQDVSKTLAAQVSNMYAYM